MKIFLLLSGSGGVGGGRDGNVPLYPADQCKVAFDPKQPSKTLIGQLRDNGIDKVPPTRALSAKDMKANTLLLLAIGFGISVSAVAQHNHSAQTPYAGMQNRAIKSLSDSDILELRRGGGWGLALPAELNGMPGPVHLLELKDQIPLATDQVPQIQALIDDMRNAAIPAGECLVAAEAAIEAAFASGAIEERSLRGLLADAESARTEIRFIHLSQHYKAAKIITPKCINAIWAASDRFWRCFAAKTMASIPLMGLSAPHFSRNSEHALERPSRRVWVRMDRSDCGPPTGRLLEH